MSTGAGDAEVDKEEATPLDDAKFNFIFSPSVGCHSFGAASVSSFCGGSLPAISLSLCARRTCSSIILRSLSSSPRSCISFFLNASCLLSASGLLSIHEIKIPFSPSSTLQIPSRPRYFANSVRLGQRVAFMCMCSLLAMYSW